MYASEDPRDTTEPFGQPRETPLGTGIPGNRGGSGSGDPFPEAEDSGAGPGEAGPRGETRFTFQGEAPPHVAIGCINGRLSVRPHRGEEGNVAILRATDESGVVVPLDQFAEVTFDPLVGILRVEPVTAIRRQFHHVLRGVTLRDGHLFEHLIELIERLGDLGIRWPVIDIDATVPPDCKLELSSASGAIDVAGVAGPVTIRTASGTVNAAGLTGGVTARTVSGALAVHDTSGAVHAHSVSGEVTLVRASGPLIVHTVSGDVRADQVSGAFGFKSVSGDLEVGLGSIDRLYASTTSGDIEIDAELRPAGHELRTVSGSVRLRPQAGFGARLSGRTLSGNFTCRLPYTASDGGSPEPDDPRDRDMRPPRESRRRGKNRWEYLVGDRDAAEQGDTRLRIRTVSGSLTIEPSRLSTASASSRASTGTINREAAAATGSDGAQDSTPGHLATSPTSPRDEQHLAGTHGPSASAAGHEPRLAVLEALRRDEVSTEEALRLLAELDGAA